MGPPLGTTQTTATITSAEGLQRATFTTPPQTVPGTNTTEPPPPPLRNKGPELGADNLTLEGVATELAPMRCPQQAWTKALRGQSPPSSDSEDSRRKRRRRVSSSSEDSSDNEDAETGHWKSKNKYREDEDEDMSRLWRRQKVDAFTRRISDFSEDKKRRMPANVKTYDGTGDS
ncbi:hypothetical protein Tco_0228123 [Tanacetum coccineum]